MKSHQESCANFMPFEIGQTESKRFRRTSVKLHGRGNCECLILNDGKMHEEHYSVGTFTIQSARSHHSNIKSLTMMTTTKTTTE